MEAIQAVLELHGIALDRQAGAEAYSLVRTVRSTRATLTGLTRGVTYRILVVPVNLAHQTGTGTSAMITVR